MVDQSSSEEQQQVERKNVHVTRSNTGQSVRHKSAVTQVDQDMQTGFDDDESHMFIPIDFDRIRPERIAVVSRL